MIAGICSADRGYGRIDGRRNQHSVFTPRAIDSHQHGLGGRRSTVIHRGIADIHAGEFAHHRLILKDILQRTLRNLRLIRGICRQKLRASEYGVDCGRSIVVIVTASGKAGQRAVFGIKTVEKASQLRLAKRTGQVIGLLEPQ